MLKLKTSFAVELCVFVVKDLNLSGTQCPTFAWRRNVGHCVSVVQDLCVFVVKTLASRDRRVRILRSMHTHGCECSS